MTVDTPLNVAGKPPTDAISEALNECWEVARENDPDALEPLWSGAYSNVPPDSRRRYEALTPSDQLSIIERLKARTGEWAPWTVIRLARQAPFRDWQEWRREARLSLVNGVVQDTQKGYIQRFRAFILPKLAAKTPHVSTWHLNLRDRHSLEIILCQVPWCLAWFCACNLRDTLRGVVPLLLLLAGTVLLMQVPGIARSEPRLDEMLLWFVACSGLLVVLQAYRVMREVSAVRREGWWKIWNDPKNEIRIVGDPTVVSRPIQGDSYGLAVVAACFTALHQKVSRHAEDGRSSSHLRTAVAELSERLHGWALTGSIWGAIIGGWYKHAPVQRKWQAVEAAQIPRFLLPISCEAARRFVDQCSLLRWLRRWLGGCLPPVITRQKVGGFLPTSLLRIAGRSRPGTWLLSAQAAVLSLAFLGSCWLLARPVPDLDKPPRWFPRTENSVAINDLQLDFNHVFFVVDPSDYFVMVEGHTSAASQSSGRAGPSRIASVYGEASLEMGDRVMQTAVAVIHLRAQGAVPDPHLLQVELFQRRHLLWWRLPPRRLRAFGIPNVSFAQAGTTL